MSNYGECVLFMERADERQPLVLANGDDLYRKPAHPVLYFNTLHAVRPSLYS